MKRLVLRAGLIATALLATRCIPLPSPGKGEQQKVTASCRTLRTGGLTSQTRRATSATPETREPTAYEIAKGAMMAPANPGLAPQNIVGAGGVTAGFVLQGLQGLLQSVNRLLQSASGETQIILGTLKADIGNTITQFQDLLGDDLNHTIDKLNEVQREFVDNVDRMIPELQRSITAIETHATQDVIMTLHEADILAYNVLYSLPTRPQPPRVVYWSPTTYANDGQDHLVELHGNFLNIQPPKVKVNGSAAQPAGTTDNMTQVLLRAPAGDGPTTNTQQRIDMTYTGCEPTTCFPWENCQPKLTTVPAAVTVTMTPKIRYGVKATITPAGRKAQHQTFSFPFYFRSEDCGYDQVTNTVYCLPGGWAVESPLSQPTVNDSNCPGGASRIVSTTLSGSNCVEVRQHIVGCGYGIIHDCKGRGWLGYTLNVNGKQNVNTTFTAQNFEANNTTNTTFTFQYNQSLPSDAIVDSWQWTASITSSTGVVVSLSSASPTAGTKAHGVLRNGILTVTIDDKTLLTELSAPESGSTLAALPPGR